MRKFVATTILILGTIFGLLSEIAKKSRRKPSFLSQGYGGTNIKTAIGKKHIALTFSKQFGNSGSVVRDTKNGEITLLS